MDEEEEENKENKVGMDGARRGLSEATGMDNNKRRQNERQEVERRAKEKRQNPAVGKIICYSAQTSLHTVSSGTGLLKLRQPQTS